MNNSIYKGYEKKIRARVFIVDDHPIVRRGLAQLINQEADLEVCGEAEDSAMALALLPTVKPDVIIVDISLKGSNGLELIKDIKQRYNKMPVVVLSMHDENLYAERALRAGAKGYVMKQEGAEKVISVLRKVLQGEISVSESLASKLLGQLSASSENELKSPMELLSDRELEVYQMIGHGKGTRQVAEALCLSIKTIEAYREHIKRKLKLKNAVELIQSAVRAFSQDKQI